jgi:DNA-binding protein H-NS
MTIDLNSLTGKQLDALIAQAKKRKAALGKRKPVATVRSKLTALAKAEGYTIAELFGPTVASGDNPAPRKASAKGRKLGKVEPKYRNPEIPSQTWSGRGMQPKWLAEQVRRGKSAADFLIRASLTPKPHRPGVTLIKADESA